MDVFEKESGDFFELAKMYQDALLKVHRDEASRMIIKVKNGDMIR